MLLLLVVGRGSNEDTPVGLPALWWAGLEVLTEDAAPTARHALYDLGVLALLILTLEAKVDPALVAGVGCLSG
jgi:hypothetical protein